MDRITKSTVGCFKYTLADHKSRIGEFGNYDTFFDYSMAVMRLGELEDIIFDTDGKQRITMYRLKELVDAELKEKDEETNG